LAAEKAGEPAKAKSYYGCFAKIHEKWGGLLESGIRACEELHVTSRRVILAYP
jgi:hypothetical protein